MVGSETEDYQRNLFDLDATSTQLNARVGESGGRDTDRDVVANMRSPRRCELSRTTGGMNHFIAGRQQAVFLQPTPLDAAWRRYCLSHQKTYICMNNVGSVRSNLAHRFSDPGQGSHGWRWRKN
jgi:hypothetical protein